MSKEGSNYVIDCTNFSFGFSILRGGVRTRESEEPSFLFKKLMRESIIVFFSLVTLKTFISRSNCV